MDSNVESTDKSSISPRESQVALSHGNCEDELQEAPEIGKTETTMEEQSNNGNGTGINDGDRFINSRLGKQT